MILTKYLKISAKGTQYYKLGYIKDNGYYTIKIEDLSKGSHQKIKVKCDICGNEKELSYKKYNKNISNGGYYSCSQICSIKKKKSTFQKKYGVDNPFQSKKIKEKIKKTNLEKFGVEYALQNKEIFNKVKNTIMEKYNVDNVFQSNEIKEKIKQTNLKKYGVENPMQNETIKKKYNKTCLNKYGVEFVLQSKEIREKSKKTCLEKYGVEFITQSNEVKEKIKQTNLEKYGVENPFLNKKVKEKFYSTMFKKYGVKHALQNKELFEKSRKSMFKLEKYNNLIYQGSYEKDFLDKYYNKIIIINGKIIKYKFKKDDKIYYSDFYLPDYNLIVEIKSQYIFDLHKELNLQKQEASIKCGYDFIFIIDKDYTKFEKIIK